jgi:hypothetical protein
MEESDPLQESVANVAADLLSQRRFQPIVRCILEVPAGVWQTVASCCSGAEELPKFAADIFAEHADRYVVTYLPWPGLDADDPGCMIVFVHDDELWSTTVYFNRASLENASETGNG